MPSEPAEPASAPAAATILVADDEALIRSLTSKILERDGYHVLLAEDGLQALEIYQRERARIGLVILDRTMPGLSGDDTCRRLLALEPNVRVVLSSGYFPEDLGAIHPRIRGFLSKPYRREELIHAVRAALESSDGPSDVGRIVE
jgi:two-component system, cell cycle sensor histidine kinase and response regulator CckA